MSRFVRAAAAVLAIVAPGAFFPAPARAQSAAPPHVLEAARAALRPFPKERILNEQVPTLKE